MLMMASHCSAALYVVKVLRGAPPADLKKETGTDVAAAAASEVSQVCRVQSHNRDKDVAACV